MRHALGHPAVLEVARDLRLLGIAKEILGCDPFPFRATLLTNLSRRIGSSCGLKTPHCRSTNDVRFRSGDLGR